MSAESLERMLVSFDDTAQTAMDEEGYYQIDDNNH